MTTIREIDLPGIGRKFQMSTLGGDQLVIIIHDDGTREVYRTHPLDPDTTISVATLSDDEARILASIIGGMQYKPKALETIEVVLGNLIIEWYKVEPSYECVGRSIGQLEVRQRTGASIIAVVEPGEAQRITPGPDYVLQSESLLIVTGERKSLRALKDLLAHGR